MYSPYDPIVEILKSQGARIESPDDLKPALLEGNGYVGCFIAYEDRVECVWIKGDHGSIEDLARTAEWLTQQLVTGPLSVSTAIARVVTFSRSISRVHRHPLDFAGLLSVVAWQMDFIEDRFSNTLQMPSDHPLYQR